MAEAEATKRSRDSPIGTRKPSNSGGSDGWWDIDELLVGHNEIRGRFRLNALNRPTLNIDRRSGAITVEGMIAFNGRCEMDSGHRRF